MAERERFSDGRGRQPRVVRLALEFVAFCHRYQALLKRARPTLNEQIQETADSILLNIGEALDEESTGDKRRFLRYALRSAGEAEKALRGVAVLGLIPAPEVDTGLRILLNLRFDLKRLIQWASS